MFGKHPFYRKTRRSSSELYDFGVKHCSGILSKAKEKLNETIKWRIYTYARGLYDYYIKNMIYKYVCSTISIIISHIRIDNAFRAI